MHLEMQMTVSQVVSKPRWDDSMGDVSWDIWACTARVLSVKYLSAMCFVVVNVFADNFCFPHKIISDLNS